MAVWLDLKPIVRELRKAYRLQGDADVRRSAFGAALTLVLSQWKCAEFDVNSGKHVSRRMIKRLARLEANARFGFDPRFDLDQTSTLGASEPDLPRSYLVKKGNALQGAYLAAGFEAAPCSDKSPG